MMSYSKQIPGADTAAEASRAAIRSTYYCNWTDAANYARQNCVGLMSILKGSTDGSVTLQAPADTNTDKTSTLPTVDGMDTQAPMVVC